MNRQVSDPRCQVLGLRSQENRGASYNKLRT
jgi:hypothetical protein